MKLNFYSNLLLLTCMVFPCVNADSFLYVTSIAENKLATYKIINGGQLQDMNKTYNLPSRPYDLGTYNIPGNPNRYIFLAYYDSNQIGVWRAHENGDLTLVGEYNTSANPDPISSVLNDRFIYVNSLSQQRIDGYNFNPLTGELSTMDGSPFNTDGGTYAYMFSPNGKYLYGQYFYENALATLKVDQTTGIITPPVNKISTGITPFHYTIFNGYLYLLGTNSNGVSKYKLSSDESYLIPANQYALENLDYKFNFIPLRMMRLNNFLYITDTSNNVNIFKIGTNSNLTPVDIVDSSGAVGRSLVFGYQNYAYQPIFQSNKINQYEVESETGRLTLLHSYNTLVQPFHIAIFMW